MLFLHLLRGFPFAHGWSRFVTGWHGLSQAQLVTGCHGLSRFVTVRHGSSRFVTVCHGLSRRKLQNGHTGHASAPQDTGSSRLAVLFFCFLFFMFFIVFMFFILFLFFVAILKACPVRDKGVPCRDFRDGRVSCISEASLVLPFFLAQKKQKRNCFGTFSQMFDRMLLFFVTDCHGLARVSRIVMGCHGLSRVMGLSWSEICRR